MSDREKKSESPNIAKLNWKGKDGDLEFLLTEDATTTIGRDKINDIVLPGRKISKQHAILVWLEGAFVITDLDSTNGTYVNDKMIKEPTTLRDSDQLNIAGFALNFTQTESLVEEMKTKIFEIPQSMTPPEVSDSPLQPSESQIEHLETKIFEGSPAEVAEVKDLPAPPAEKQIEHLETKVFQAPTPDVAEEAVELPSEPAGVQEEVNHMTEAITALMDQLRAVQVTAETLENTWGDTRTRLKVMTEQLETVARKLTELEQRTVDAGLVDLLDKLTANPRDVTLLIELSQQAALISDLTQGFASQAVVLGEVKQSLGSEIAQLPD